MLLVRSALTCAHGTLVLSTHPFQHFLGPVINKHFPSFCKPEEEKDKGKEKRKQHTTATNASQMHKGGSGRKHGAEDNRGSESSGQHTLGTTSHNEESQLGAPDRGDGDVEVSPPTASGKTTSRPLANRQ